jgi:hypothetical protein
VPVDVKFSTRATANGGRDGNAKSEDGKLDLKLSTPKELGGAGGPGTNPEQLFAAGYSACFIGAMKVAGGQLGNWRGTWWKPPIKFAPIPTQPVTMSMWVSRSPSE